MDSGCVTPARTQPVRFVVFKLRVNVRKSMAREATDGDSPSLGDELDLVVDIIRLYDYVTMNDDDDELRVVCTYVYRVSISSRYKQRFWGPAVAASPPT